MYLEDQEQFRNTARFWTETYAIVRSSVDEAVQRLVDMGFAAVSPSPLGPLASSWAYTRLVTTGPGQAGARGDTGRRERGHREARQQHVTIPTERDDGSRCVQDMKSERERGALHQRRLHVVQLAGLSLVALAAYFFFLGLALVERLAVCSPTFCSSFFCSSLRFSAVSFAPLSFGAAAICA
jgi:hypothetical protein